MKSFIRYFSLFFCVLFLVNCATGEGSTTGSTGLAAVSFEVEEGDIVSADDYNVTLTRLALCIGGVTMGDVALTDDVAAEFATEEVVEFVEMEDLPADEYEELSVSFCQASEAVAAAAKTGDGEEVELADMEGYALYAEGEATNGADSCTFIVKLDSLADVVISGEEGAHVAIDEEAESEVLLHFHAADIFAELDMADLGCVGDATVEISDISNTEEADALIEALTSEAFELVSVDGDDGHNH